MAKRIGTEPEYRNFPSTRSSIQSIILRIQTLGNRLREMEKDLAALEVRNSDSPHQGSRDEELDRKAKLESSRQADIETLRKAKFELFQRYAGPLKTFLMVRWRDNSQNAGDFVSSFMMKKLQDPTFLSGFDQTKGRFRNYIRKALHFCRLDARRREMAERSRLGALPEGVEDIPTGPDEPGEIAYEKEILVRLIQEAIESVRQQYQQPEKLAIWDIFHEQFLYPFWDRPPTTYAELVARHNLESPAKAQNLLVTGKRCFERHLMEAASKFSIDDPEARVMIDKFIQRINGKSRRR